MLELNVIYFSIGILGFTAGPKCGQRRRRRRRRQRANIGSTETGGPHKRRKENSTECRQQWSKTRPCVSLYHLAGQMYCLEIAGNPF